MRIAHSLHVAIMDLQTQTQTQTQTESEQENSLEALIASAQLVVNRVISVNWTLGIHFVY